MFAWISFVLTKVLTTYVIKIHRFYYVDAKPGLIRTNQTLFDVNRGTVSKMNC